MKRIPTALRRGHQNVLSTSSISHQSGRSRPACPHSDFSKTTCRRFFSSRIITTTSGIRDCDTKETVEGVWIFHRHGDRTPARSIIANHMRDVEAAYWETKIPPTDLSYYKALSRRFPVNFEKRRKDKDGSDEGIGDKSDDGFLDGRKAPYGFLTWKGMDQMYNVGKQMRMRYDPPKGDEAIEDADRSKDAADFFNKWNFKIYSTRYLRTVMSVQCFLHGMTDGANTNNNDDNKEKRLSFYQNTSPSTILNTTPTSTPKLQILVRHRSTDTLNSFDRNPPLMKSLVQSVISQPSFLMTDARAAPLAARLANYLPGLARASSYGGPSGINWIHAVDHFVCRESHGLGLGEFGDGEEEGEEVMEAMRACVVRHLTWRFRMWYSNESLLGAIAGPVLGELGGHIADSVAERNARPPFVLYSCHDVTILGLLYGIGADFVASSEELREVGVLDELADSEQRWQYWPDYASTLMFELIRLEKNESNGEAHHVVRIFLDGKPVRILTALKDKKETPVTTNMGTDDESSTNSVARTYDIPLVDFLGLVRELEIRGNFDFDDHEYDNHANRHGR